MFAGLNIAVNDALHVRVGESVSDFVGDMERDVQGQLTFSGDAGAHALPPRCKA